MDYWIKIAGRKRKKWAAPISGWKQEKWTSLFNSAVSNYSKFQLKLTIVFLLDQIYPKREFLVVNGKVNIPIEFWIFELVYNQW